MKESFYDILEVSRTASPEVIRAAYKSLVQRFHPDKNPDNPNAVELLKLINNAYDTLSDPSKRAAYDVMLTLEEMANPEPEPEAAREEEKREAPAAEPRSEADQSFSDRWDLYQAYIDKNPNYYRPIFRKFHTLGTSVSPNLPVFLAGGIWAAYRKMYGIAAIHFVLVLAGIAGMHMVGTILAFLPAIAMSAWLGLMGNGLYFRSASRKIGDISRQSEDSGTAFRKIHLAGGVNLLAPLVFIGMAVIALLAPGVISPFQKKPVAVVPAPRVTAESAPVEAPQPAEIPKPAVAPAPAETRKPAEIRPPAEIQPPAEIVKPPEAKKPVEARKPVETRKPPEAPKPSPAEVQRHVEPPAPETVERRPPAVTGYADLASAVSSGDRSAVERMLKNGEDVNLIKDNQVPLIIAVKNDDLPMVKLLLSHGADVNLTDSQGNTAMMYAKIRADAKMIEMLKNAGAKNPFN